MTRKSYYLKIALWVVAFIIVATSLLFLFVSTLAVKAVGPDKATIATINEKMVITLPTNVPQSDTYMIDISAIPFSNEDVLSRFCQSFSENHMTLSGNFTTKQTICYSRKSCRLYF